LKDDGRIDLACATNRGNVYYHVQRNAALTHAKVFSLGCTATAVAGLSRPERSGLVAVGIDASYMHVLDGKGKLVWSRPTESPVTAV